MGGVADRDADLEILQSCLAGIPEARDAFARHFEPLVASVVHDADLSQEVFATLFADDCLKLRKFDPARGSVAGWIGMIARQTASKRRERPPAVPLPGNLQAPPDSGEEDTEAVLLALKALPSREALCLALLFEQDLGIPDAAAILGVSPRTAYEIRDRALEKIRKKIRDL